MIDYIGGIEGLDALMRCWQLGRSDLIWVPGMLQLLLGTMWYATLRDPIKKSRVERNGHVLESRPKIVLLLHRRISIQLLLVWHLLRTGTRNPDAHYWMH